jgi:polar amino acid transport system substrate-binding protein
VIRYLIVFSSLLLSSITLSDELRFGTFSHPPYAYKNSSDQYVGSLYEVANAIVVRSGLQGRNEVLHTKRLFQQLKSGQTDCSLMIRNEITEANFDLIEPIGEVVTTGILPARGVYIEKYRDLSDVRIAVPSGIFIHPPFDKDSSLIKVPSNNYGHSALMLKRGRVEAMAGVIESMYFNVRVYDIPDAQMAPPFVFSRFPIWLLCAKGQLAEEKVVRLKRAVIELREEGVIRTIFSDHFSAVH